VNADSRIEAITLRNFDKEERGIEGTTRIRKRTQETVTQRLDHPTPMVLDCRAGSIVKTRDHRRPGLVAHFDEVIGRPHKIEKEDRR
jgi:hypothetical protein